MRWKKVLVGDGTLFLLEFSELITHYMVFCFFFSVRRGLKDLFPLYYVIASDTFATPHGPLLVIQA